MYKRGELSSQKGHLVQNINTNIQWWALDVLVPRALHSLVLGLNRRGSKGTRLLQKLTQPCAPSLDKGEIQLNIQHFKPIVWRFRSKEHNVSESHNI
jgi:hypothetical protein